MRISNSHISTVHHRAQHPSEQPAKTLPLSTKPTLAMACTHSLTHTDRPIKLTHKHTGARNRATIKRRTFCHCELAHLTVAVTVTDGSDNNHRVVRDRRERPVQIAGNLPDPSVADRQSGATDHNRKAAENSHLCEIPLVSINTDDNTIKLKLVHQMWMRRFSFHSRQLSDKPRVYSYCSFTTAVI